MHTNSYSSCRLRLDYMSLVKLGLLLGLCAGLMSIPLLLLLNLSRTDLDLLSIVCGAPLAGMACGLLLAVLGYPLYSWVSARTKGQKYSGTFRIDTGNDAG